MKHLEFKRRFGELIRDGRKRATIRTKTNLKVGDEVLVHSGGKIIGKAVIESIEAKSFEELSDDDAVDDGFTNREELIKELRKLYGTPEKVYIIRFSFSEFEQPVTPEDMYYGGFKPEEIADLALRYLELSEKEKEILKIYLEEKSLRRAARSIGGLSKRKILRKILRDCYRRLSEEGLLKKIKDESKENSS